MKKKEFHCKKYPEHTEQIPYLKKIEGQIRGIIKMIEENRYCMDILFQIRSVMRALERVENGIFKKHLESCVMDAARSRNVLKRREKIDEIIKLIKKIKNI